MIDNNVERIKDCVSEIMNILNIEKTTDNELTPLRVAKMLNNELFVNRNNQNIETLNSQMKVFKARNNNPISMFNIEVFSMCSHHWLPFYGVCSVKYVPDKHIIGLSKIPRVVEYFSKKPQVQEDLTNEIGEYLTSIIKPQYLGVTMTCTHTCVSGRGIKSGAETRTIYEYGEID